MIKHKPNSGEIPSLAERAYEQLEQRIITLQFKPGAVYSETELSAQLQIGRTPIREALQRLASQRLVQSIPRHGIRITEIDVAEHLALLETRRELDRLLARKAARRATPDQRLQFRRIAAQMSTAILAHDMDGYLRADHAFDELLEETARNPFAAATASVLHAHCRRFWYTYRMSTDIDEVARLHIAMMQAVAEGDESAAATASDQIIDYMEGFTKKALDL